MYSKNCESGYHTRIMAPNYCQHFYFWTMSYCSGVYGAATETPIDLVGEMQTTQNKQINKQTNTHTNKQKAQDSKT